MGRKEDYLQNATRMFLYAISKQITILVYKIWPLPQSRSLHTLPSRGHQVLLLSVSTGPVTCNFHLSDLLQDTAGTVALLVSHLLISSWITSPATKSSNTTVHLSNHSPVATSFPIWMLNSGLIKFFSFVHPLFSVHFIFWRGGGKNHMETGKWILQWNQRTKCKCRWDYWGCGQKKKMELGLRKNCSVEC